MKTTIQKWIGRKNTQKLDIKFQKIRNLMRWNEFKLKINTKRKQPICKNN